MFIISSPQKYSDSALWQRLCPCLCKKRGICFLRFGLLSGYLERSVAFVWYLARMLFFMCHNSHWPGIVFGPPVPYWAILSTLCGMIIFEIMTKMREKWLRASLFQQLFLFCLKYVKIMHETVSYNFYLMSIWVVFDKKAKKSTVLNWNLKIIN